MADNKLPSNEWQVRESVRAIKKLGRAGARFCKVYPGQKRPVGSSWNEKENTFVSESEELLNWIKSEQGDSEGESKGYLGNYGVVGGFGNLTIFDEDDGRITKLRKASLPETFVVSTCHNDFHSYFTIPNFGGSIRLQDPRDPGTVVGDIQDEGKMVVGPGSVIYPEYDKKKGTGGYYEIVDDRLPAFTKENKIRKAFKDFIDAKKKRKKIPVRDAKVGGGVKTSGIDITDVGKIREFIEKGKLTYRNGGKYGGYYYGPHPVHGSTTGKNFHVVPSLNCFHCYRNGHDSGGGPLWWIAIEEGLIDCSEAYKGSPALSGEKGWKFREVLESAVERGLIEEENAGILDEFSSKEVEPEKLGEVIEIE